MVVCIGSMESNHGTLLQTRFALLVLLEAYSSSSTASTSTGTPSSMPSLVEAVPLTKSMSDRYVGGPSPESLQAERDYRKMCRWRSRSL